MEMGATVAFQEDGSWQNEAKQASAIAGNWGGQGAQIKIKRSQKKNDDDVSHCVFR